MFVKSSGFVFFTNRNTLERENGKLGARFAAAKHVDALWIKGGSFYDENENTHVVKRLILPDPESESIRFFAQSVDQEDIGSVIRAVTEKATRVGAKVKWCKEFPGVSMNLVDTGRENGWTHVEVVLPFSKPNDRPSFTIKKSRSPDSVLEFQRVFNVLWDESVAPSGSAPRPPALLTSTGTTNNDDTRPEYQISVLLMKVLRITMFDGPDPSGALPKLLRQIRQEVIYGRIDIWGRVNCDEEFDELELSPRVHIPKEFWAYNKIDEYKLILNNGRIITKLDSGHSTDITYSDLAVSRDQARRVWPQANI